MNIKVYGLSALLLLCGSARAEPRGDQMPPNERLLEQAEALMAEAARRSDDAHAPVPSNPKPYEEAKRLFEAALERDPASARAQRGIADCDEMLTPLHPVQHMMPPPAALEIGPALGPPKPPASPAERAPWEARRAAREAQRRGVAYTGEVYARESKRYRAEAAQIVAAAQAKVVSGAVTTREAYAEAEARLEEMRRAADRGWKGHGPRFYPEAIRDLKRALELP